LVVHPHDRQARLELEGVCGEELLLFYGRVLLLLLLSATASTSEGHKEHGNKCAKTDECVFPAYGAEQSLRFESDSCALTKKFEVAILTKAPSPSLGVRRGSILQKGL
jgi:hypothetical protein